LKKQIAGSVRRERIASEPTPEPTPEPALDEELRCARDLACWGERYSTAAERHCRQPIEELALIDFEWTNGWLMPRFSHFRWSDARAARDTRGVITTSATQ